MTKKKFAIVTLRKQGYNLFTLAPKSKLPNGSWKKWQTEKCDEFIPDNSNYAVACGYNNLIVIDLDHAELFKDFEEYNGKTWIIKTGKGYHIYLRHCNSSLPKTLRLENNKGQRIDIQSLGAYVVGAGSIHPDTNKEYEIICDKEIMEIDFHEVTKKLESLGFKPDQKKTINEIMNGVGEGSRDDAAYKFARYLINDTRLDENTAWSELTKWNQRNIPPLEEWQLKKCFDSALGRGVDESQEEDKKKSSKLATKYAEEFLEKYSFATIRDTEEVLYYQKGVYKKGGEVFIKELCQQKAAECSIYITRETIGKIQRSTYKNREDFDKDSNILNLKNGLLDIKTGIVTPHNKDQLYRIQLPVGYDKDAKCPFFEKCLSEWLPDERDQVMITEQAANILLKKNGLLVVAMYNGFGSNGKSKWLDFLSAFLGKENIASVSIHDLVTNRFAASRLDGKLANIYADIENTELEHIGKFKLLSAGDSVEVEKKGKDAFMMEPIAKHFFSTNKMPSIEDDTDALYRRFQVTDFSRQFLDDPSETDLENGILPKDPFLLEKLCVKSEFSGFLNLLISTAKKLQEQKRLTYPQSIQQVREVMKEKADPVTKFASGCLIEKMDAVIPRDVLYSIHCEWSRDNQENTMSQIKFNAKIKQTLKVVPDKIRLNEYDNPVNVWVGIQFAQNDITKNLCSRVPDVPEFYTRKTKRSKDNILFGERKHLEHSEHLEQKESDNEN